MANILAVEDEPKVPGAIQEGLEKEGHEIFFAQTGKDSSSGNLLDRPVRFCCCFSRFSEASAGSSVGAHAHDSLRSN